MEITTSPTRTGHVDGRFPPKEGIYITFMVITKSHKLNLIRRIYRQGQIEKYYAKYLATALQMYRSHERQIKTEGHL